MKKALEDNNQLVFEQMAPYYELEQKINDYRSVLRDANLKDIETGKYSYQLGVFYMDFINHCEKLADHVINVVETLFLKDKE
jgi:Na+/phosphate symporter